MLPIDSLQGLSVADAILLWNPGQQPNQPPNGSAAVILDPNGNLNSDPQTDFDDFDLDSATELAPQYGGSVADLIWAAAEQGQAQPDVVFQTSDGALYYSAADGESLAVAVDYGDTPGPGRAAVWREEDLYSFSVPRHQRAGEHPGAVPRHAYVHPVHRSHPAARWHPRHLRPAVRSDPGDPVRGRRGPRLERPRQGRDRRLVLSPDPSRWCDPATGDVVAGPAPRPGREHHADRRSAGAAQRRPDDRMLAVDREHDAGLGAGHPDRRPHRPDHLQHPHVRNGYRHSHCPSPGRRRTTHRRPCQHRSGYRCPSLPRGRILPHRYRHALQHRASRGAECRRDPAAARPDKPAERPAAGGPSSCRRSAAHRRARLGIHTAVGHRSPVGDPRLHRQQRSDVPDLDGSERLHLPDGGGGHQRLVGQGEERRRVGLPRDPPRRRHGHQDGHHLVRRRQEVDRQPVRRSRRRHPEPGELRRQHDARRDPRHQQLLPQPRQRHRQDLGNG